MVVKIQGIVQRVEYRSVVCGDAIRLNAVNCVWIAPFDTAAPESRDYKHISVSLLRSPNYICRWCIKRHSFISMRTAIYPIVEEIRRPATRASKHTFPADHSGSIKEVQVASCPQGRIGPGQTPVGSPESGYPTIIVARPCAVDLGMAKSGGAKVGEMAGCEKV